MLHLHYVKKIKKYPYSKQVCHVHIAQVSMTISYSGTCVYLHWTVSSSPMWEGRHGTSGTTMSVVHVHGTVLSCPVLYPMWGRTGQVGPCHWHLTVRACVYLYSCPILSNMSRVVSAVGIQLGFSEALTCLVSCGTGQSLHSTAIFTVHWVQCGQSSLNMD